MLDPSSEEIRGWANSVIQLMSDYLGSLPDRGVYRHMVSRRIRDRLDTALPRKGTDFDTLLKVFREDIIPFSRQNGIMSSRKTFRRVSKSVPFLGSAVSSRSRILRETM